MVLINFSTGFSYRRHETSTKLLRDFKNKKNKVQILNYHPMNHQFPWLCKSIGFPDMFIEPISYSKRNTVTPFEVCLSSSTSGQMEFLFIGCIWSKWTKSENQVVAGSQQNRHNWILSMRSLDQLFKLPTECEAKKQICTCTLGFMPCDQYGSGDTLEFWDALPKGPVVLPSNDIV